MKGKSKVLMTVIAIVMCMVTLIGCGNVKFNQTTNKKELLTKKYSVVQIEKLQKAAETGAMTFSDFKRDFDVQCVRKTHQGYYVVLLFESDENVFAFFNEKNTLFQIIISGDFKSKAEFQDQVVEQIPKSEVLNLDPNAIVAPVSSLEITAHIVQEGLFIVKYSRFKEGKIIEDPIVDSVQFIENESISVSNDPFIRDEIPYIFEIDKVGN